MIQQQQPRPAKFHLAILECDTPLPPVEAEFGSYGQQFKTLLDAAAHAMGRPDLSPMLATADGQKQQQQQLEASCWDVVGKEDEYPDLEAVDGVLMTGSRYNAFDDTPWIQKLVEYIKKCLATQRIRIVGVCFGHQILGRAMGAKVGRNAGAWELAVNDITLNAKGKKLFGKDTISLHQMHQDIVYDYPPGVEELGSSPVCKIQGMYSPNRIISVQGHPEFNKPILEQILASRHAQGIFNDTQYEDGMKKVGLHHDGVLVAQAFLRFLTEDR